VRHDEEVGFKVRVHNQSTESKVLSMPTEVAFETLLVFLPGAPSGVLISKMRERGIAYTGNGSITRRAIDTDPPRFDHLEAGDFRDYELRWKPSADDQGKGALQIELPFEFPEIPLQPMTISNP
jgi:hypothetical protein